MDPSLCPTQVLPACQTDLGVAMLGLPLVTHTLAPVSWHTQSTQGMLTNKGTALSLGEVAVSPNSSKLFRKCNKMKKLRNTFQTKEQSKTPRKKKNPNEIEISNLLNKELKAMVRRRLSKLGRRTNELHFFGRGRNSKKEPIRAEEYNNYMMEVIEKNV